MTDEFTQAIFSGGTMNGKTILMAGCPPMFYFAVVEEISWADPPPMEDGDLLIPDIKKVGYQRTVWKHNGFVIYEFCGLT